MSKIGKLQTTYTARGFVRYEIEVSHPQLHKFQIVRGDDETIVRQKAQAIAAQWDDMGEKRREVENRRKERADAARDVEAKKALAADRTDEARGAIEQLERTLVHTLTVNDAVDWDSLRDVADFPEPTPIRHLDPPVPSTPDPIPEPNPDDPRFRPKRGFFDFIFPSKRAAKVAAAQQALSLARHKWQEALNEQKRRHQCALEAHTASVRSLDEEHRAAVAVWEERRAQYLAEQRERNAAVDAKKQQYLNSDLGAISDYCGMVLSNSSYPDCLPQSYDLEYNPDNHLLVVDYQLPAPGDAPSLVEVRYVQSKDEFVEKQMSSSQFNQIYDGLLYQIALRTIHELYEADVIHALESIVFNGYVRSIDAATGQETNACVLSVQAGREEFATINLASVEPHACFKKLKGVGSARLHSLAAIAPILTMSREDKRFVASYAMADGIAEGDNLAAMDWEDFEHLIRELFEKEFSAVGGEVKVTRASRDGGVDAVIFDPDPLRGGKTVIQAKRYTNTVGVSAVRDLYGTVLNEGANKGILVTTSDYGPDAYEFAKGKPLVLLCGSNLLHLLERHGHKAKIDLQEAKRLAAEREQDH